MPPEHRLYRGHACESPDVGGDIHADIDEHERVEVLACNQPMGIQHAIGQANQLRRCGGVLSPGVGPGRWRQQHDLKLRAVEVMDDAAQQLADGMFPEVAREEATSNLNLLLPVLVAAPLSLSSDQRLHLCPPS